METLNTASLCSQLNLGSPLGMVSGAKEDQVKAYYSSPSQYERYEGGRPAAVGERREERRYED